MHAVVGKVLGTDRLKRARPDMQGDRRHSDPLVRNRAQQRRVEVQARRGGGNRPGMFPVHGLIALLVLGVRRARDVRRQRRGAVGVEEFQHAGREPQQVELAATLQHGHGLTVHQERALGMQGLADTHLAERGVGGLDALDQDLGPATGVLDRAQPRLDHAGVVDDEQVVRAQQIDDLPKAPVHDGVAVQFQQPTVRAPRQRPPGDEMFRQAVGEV